MSNMLINRTPEIIAAEINSIKEHTRKVLLYNSIEIGRKLVEAKALLSHGEWGSWLENAVDYSKSTANNLMKIFEEYGSEQITLLDNNLKSRAFESLSYSQAVLLLGVPAEEREKFIEENNIEDMSTRELKKAIEESKKATEEKEEAIKERDKVKERLNALEETNRILEETFNEGAEERKKLNEKIEELERELDDIKSKESEIVVELEDVKINEEMEATINKLLLEKEEAERKIKELQAKQNNSSVKFKVYFEEAGKSYQRLLDELDNIKQLDEIEYLKYRTATEKFLNTMLERI